MMQGAVGDVGRQAAGVFEPQGSSERSILRAMIYFNIVHKGLSAGPDPGGDLPGAGEDLASPVLLIFTLNQNVATEKICMSAHVYSGVLAGCRVGTSIVIMIQRCIDFGGACGIVISYDLRIVILFVTHVGRG